MPSTLSSAQAAHTPDFTRTLAGRVLLGIAATVAVALAAHVSIPLWFTPVPLTLQPLAVLGVGLAFAPVEAFFIMLGYLAEGAAGLPVFSPAGPGGVAQLLGVTGGFLLSYPAVAFVASALTLKLRRARVAPFWAALGACSAASVLLFAMGMGWLMQLTHMSVQAALTAAVLPFLPGEAVKVLVASGLYSAKRHQALR